MKTTTAKTTNFISILKRDNKTIRGERANRIGRAAKNAYNAAVAAKQAEIDQIDDELETMIDVSASNSTTSLNTLREFDATAFVERRASLKLKRELLLQKLDVLKQDEDFYN